MSLWLLLACAPEAPSPASLDAGQWLTRASLDLRGRRPSVEELEAVGEDLDAAEAAVRALVEDPAFGSRVAVLYDTLLMVRADAADHRDEEYPLVEPEGVLTSLGEEPLRLLARIVDEELPWTEVVTGDWTMVDAELLQWYPVEVEVLPEGDDWVPARWTDGRPPVGLLATSGLYWRHGSTSLNANRGRAAVIARALLCQDYLSTPIVLPTDLDLTDEALVVDAIENEPACVGCHVGLDPLGSYLWGFTHRDPHDLVDVVEYDPQSEWLWETTTGVPPALGGVPGVDLGDLGPQLAADPRLVGCAVETAARLSWGRELQVADTDRLVALREAFLDGGLTLRGLYAEVVASPEYRSLEPVVDADGETWLGWKQADPDLLVSQIAGLTGALPQDGLAWRQDLDGLRSFAGAGRRYGTTRLATPSPGTAVVVARTAEAAAWSLVVLDASPEHRAALFGSLDLDLDPAVVAPAELDAGLARLWRAVLGVQADAEQRASSEALWRDLQAAGASPRQAWAGVLAGLLQHPLLEVY